jgi:hypothetical protein
MARLTGLRVGLGAANDVHSSVKQVLEIITECAEVEKTAALLHRHENVFIAGGGRGASRNGPEDANILRTVARRNFQNLLAVCPKEFVDTHVSLSESP